MEVAAGGGDAGVAEGGLDQVNGGAAVEGVGGMGVAEPVGGNGLVDAGAGGGFADDASDGEWLEASVGCLLAREEDGGVGSSLGGAEELLPDGGGNTDRTGDSAFAEDGDLAAVGAGLEVAPGEIAEFAHPDTRGIEEAQYGAVARIGFEVEDAVEIGGGEDALGEAVAYGGQTEDAADVEGEVAEAVAEGEEGFDGGEDAVAGGGGEGGKGGGEVLEVGEGQGGEGLPCPGSEAEDVGLVGAAGVGGAAVEPEVDEVVVGSFLYE